VSIVQAVIGVAQIALGGWVWSRGGRPDPDVWMDIDWSNKAVARLFGGIFVAMGSAAVVLAFVAPGTGR
jgi:hypothetical protein